MPVAGRGLPKGQPSIATGTVTGSGFILGAWAAHVGLVNTTGYRTVSLSVDGGGAVVVLTISHYVQKYGTPTDAESGQAAGAGIGLLLRYETGFTPSSATSNEYSGGGAGVGFGVVYIPD